MTTTATAVPTFHRELLYLRVNLGDWIERGVAILRGLGPYALLELLLPGGSLMVLLLWLYRRRTSEHTNAHDAQQSAEHNQQDGREPVPHAVVDDGASRPAR